MESTTFDTHGIYHITFYSNIFLFSTLLTTTLDVYSFATEPRVLRIETKQVPVPSQPEVVLSDGKSFPFLFLFCSK